MAVEIPYLPDGSILSYIEYDGTYYAGDGAWITVEMRPAEDFFAVLTLKELVSGRSKHNAIWQDHKGATFHMTELEFNRAIQKAEWVAPLTIDGKWRPYKRGANYFIKPVYE